MKPIVKQSLRFSGDKVKIAEKYYAMLSDINNLKLTEREIQLVAFTAIKGNISLANVRQEFCTKYETTSPTINNIVSKLKKKKIFVKKKKLVSINPIISLDFDQDITLVIQLIHETE